MFQCMSHQSFVQTCSRTIAVTSCTTFSGLILVEVSSLIASESSRSSVITIAASYLYMTSSVLGVSSLVASESYTTVAASNLHVT